MLLPLYFPSLIFKEIYKGQLCLDFKRDLRQFFAVLGGSSCTCKSETCKFYAAVIVCGLLKLTEYFLDFFEYYISTTSKMIKKEFTQG